MTVKLVLLGAVAIIDVVVWLANQVGDANVILNVATIVIALGVAFPAIRNGRRKGIIDDLKEVVETEERLHKQTKQQLEGAAARAARAETARHEVEKELEGVKGELRRMERYAAPEAFEALVGELGEVRATIGASISAQGELILKNTELASAAVTTLERVATDLGRLAERLGAGGDRPAQV